MSITFFCSDVPQEQYVPYPDQDPEFVMTRPVAPFFEINMANGNAMDFMEMLGVKQDYCGTWTVEQLPKLLEQVLLLLNSDAHVALVEPTFRHETPGGMTVIHCGRDLEYVRHRLQEFRLLIALAITTNKTISWG